MKSIVRGGWAVALCAAALAQPARGQSAVAVSAGAATYDLSDIGTSVVVAARYERALTPFVDLQLGSSLFWYDPDSSSRVTLLLPEAGITARVPAPVRPLLGVGIGHSIGVSGRQPDDLTLYASLGLEVGSRSGWSFRPEVRVRTIKPWTGTIAEFTLGVRRSLTG